MFFTRRFLIAAAILISTSSMVAGGPQQSTNPAPAGQAVKPDVIDILPHEQPEVSPPAPTLTVEPEIKIPNYSRCSIAELEAAVPELRHLKASDDQTKLIDLLNKVGAVTVEIARKTPNLISQEDIVSEQHGFKNRQTFSYLVLQHRMDDRSVVLDEYRVDLKTGAKFESEEVVKAAAPPASTSSASSEFDLKPSADWLSPSSGAPPSQGFVNGWLHFYPANRRESDFRYLGEQKMDGRRALVVAFAQKAGLVRVPAKIGYQDKVLNVIMQGVAWIDAVTFRILRLRTDVLAAPSGVPLRQLTADVQFMEVRLAELPSPLWLPRQVQITMNLAKAVRRESHAYSNYRLFRARSKIVLTP